MKQFLLGIILVFSLNALSQDVFMGNGTFNRCVPDKFYDSGGGASNYSSNENYVTTICAVDPADFIILNFTAFNTQLNQDILTIYDGDSTSAPLIGTYSGGASGSPGTVSATPSNASGCLTIQFISNASGTGSGFAADILCAAPCQTITASIDSTTPPPGGTGVITIFPGTSVDFNGSATFSLDGSGATYSWNFADGNPVTNGQSVSHIFNNPGTYNVVLTATDTNPQGCSGTATISVIVLQSIITVNNVAYPESTYSPQQLIEDVLVSGGCSAVSDFEVQVAGNPGQTQTKSYGFFTKGGAVDFPFEEGIVLTSGRAFGGGNTINGTIVDFDNNLPGDVDLEVALGFSDTNDATFIKFNFVPTSNTISFRYIMASEEYGDFECTFTDGFAFLLREVGTTAYTNLAVLPNGDSVSVININNSTGCPANTNFFEGYNVPGPTGIRDTNYGGRTKILTAIANVTLGVTYEIKMVVADQDDFLYDSAIFLEAGSFILGGELGNDITIASGTAQCDGDSVLLDTQAPGATHTWYMDGVVIPGETTSMINVNGTGNYSVDVFFAAGCETNDSVFVEFYPDIDIDSAQDLFLCNPGAPPYNFDLTENDSLIFGSITDTANYLITYHESQSDADSDTNSITNPTMYSGSNGQIIYTRLEYQASGCYDTTTFTLNIISQPTINPVSDLILCDDVSNDGIESFDLESQTTTILGAQPATNFIVSYYASFVDADAGSNALTSPYINTTSPQPIFVRLESIGSTNCTTVSATPVFNLIVNERATANEPNDLFICDDSSNDGFGQFNLLQQIPAILGSQPASDYTVTFYESQVDAETPINQINNPATYTNGTNPQTIYVRVFKNSTPDCYGLTSFALIVNPLPLTVVPPPLVECNLSGTGSAEFTLGDATSSVLNGQTGITVTFYGTLTDAQTDTGPLDNLYTNLSNPQTIYVRLEDNATGCIGTTTLELIVNPLPVANPPTALEVCDDNTDGLAQFDLASRDAQVLNGQVGMEVTYHTTQGAADSGTGALASPYTNTVNPQTVYVRVEDISTGCYDTTTLELIVNPLPTVFPISDYILCDDNDAGDGLELFDLTTKNEEALNGQMNITVAFYASQADAILGIGALSSPYQNTVNPQTIYVGLTNTITGCSTTTRFILQVNELPTVIAPTPLRVCDDNIGDGFTAIDLTVRDGQITGGNPQYTVSYHLSQLDADSGTAPFTSPYTNISNPQTLYVRVESTVTGCHDTTTLLVEVEQAPVANVPLPLEYCDADSDGFGVFTLTDADAQITGGLGGLTVTYHETMADAENNVNPQSSPYSNIDDYMQTIYVRIESATISTDCASYVELQLIVKDTPQIEDPTPLQVCDDSTDDGFAQFDLTTKNAEVLDGLDAAQYAVSYYEQESDAEVPTGAVATPNAYTNTVAFNQTLWVRVDDTANGCYKLTTLELIVNALPVLVQPTPLTLCDVNNPGDQREPFTLEDADAQILNGQTGITLTHHATQGDANTGANPLSSPYVNTSNAQTIYVRAVTATTGCTSTITLDLRINPLPSLVAPAAINVCDGDNDGFASFDLNIRTLQIINGETDMSVTYHETMSDADSGDNPLSSPYDNIVANTQTVFARKENTITGCYRIIQLTLNAQPSPVVPTAISDYVLCDTDADGRTRFDLTSKAAEILGGQSPSQYTLTYHISSADANTGASPIASPANYTNTSNPQTIHVRLVGVGNGCVKTGAFEIRVDLPPTAVQPTPLNLCDDDVADQMTVFDLTVKDAEITGGTGSWTVSYYTTNADAQANTNAITPATAYTNMSVGGNAANPQTLYVRVTDSDTGCTDFTTLTIRVLPNPTPSTDPSDIELCDDTNTGDAEEAFDLTDNQAYILNGEGGVTPTYHTTLEDAEDGANAIPDPTAYTNTTTPQTIYVRVENNITGCYTIVDFDIIVDPLPAVVAVTDYIICEVNTDGFAQFYLTTKDAEVLNGQSPAIYNVTYHATQLGADNLTGILGSPYTNTVSPQPIYVAITDTRTGCSISTPVFNIEVDNGAEANSDTDPIEQVVCDTVGDNDGLGQFDLTLNDAEVLDGQDPTDFIVTYYATQSDAEMGTDPIPYTYENISSPQVIYVRVDNDTPDAAGMDSSICYAVAQLTLRVDLLPIFDLDDSYTLCVGTNGTEVLGPPVLATGLPATGHTFEWSLDGTVLPGETGPNLTATQGGTYTVLVTNTVTTCTNTDSAEVVISSPPTVNVTVDTQAFSQNHVITATATGDGQYEYSLDGGPWQQSGTFENVSFGEHTVTARDMNGCGQAKGTVTVLDYPHFFTPNGDGRNETWNIVGFAGQPSAKIYIFDRFGKLLKQISPSGRGWNGTYNGTPMPTSDYWFTVEYTEDGQMKQFRAHFTLKR